MASTHTTTISVTIAQLYKHSQAISRNRSTICSAMEFTIHSISRPNLPLPFSLSNHPNLHGRITTTTSSTFPPLLLRPDLNLTFQRNRRSLLQPLHASKSDSDSQSSFRWLLVPVGDGKWKHIGSKVEMPDAFEIVSNEVTVGRLPDKADVVIPVATVSGVHARIKKQGDRLLVIDLDSTNGTFIDDKRLNPGVVAAVSSGNCITFGDIHLAMFQVSKFKGVEAATQGVSEESISNSEIS